MKKHALLIGIDSYDEASITPLACAARDARELGSFFKHKLGFETTVLTHEELRRDKRINRELRRIRETLHPGDLFVLFFAGHGKTTSQNDQFFLLPDASSRALEQGIASEGVLSLLALRAETDAWDGVQRAFIVDACRMPIEQALANSRDSSAAKFAGEAAFRNVAFGPAKRAATPSSPTSPFVILNSCQNEQRAEELPAYGHGLFTAALLATLEDYALAQKSVALNEGLTQALATRMRTLAQSHGGRQTQQTPLLLGDAVVLSSGEEAQSQWLHATLANFERQLQSKQLDSPVGDNCLETLQKLGDKHYPQLAALNARVQAALEAREVEAKRKRDQQRFNVAQERNTVTALENYLASCELCEHIEAVRASLRSLSGAAPAPTPVPKPASAPNSHSPIHSSSVSGTVESLWQKVKNQYGRIYRLVRIFTGILLILFVASLILLLIALGVMTFRGKLGPSASPTSTFSARTIVPTPAVAPASSTTAAELPKYPVKSSFQDTLADGSLGPWMVVLPKGDVKLGSIFEDDEKNGPQVTFAQSFAVGQYEVTVKEYLACVKVQACKPPRWQEADAPSYYKELGEALTGESFPIVSVSWHDAKSYVAWLNTTKLDGKYSLLSEAQWEYSARAGSVLGILKEETMLKDNAWHSKNSGGKTHAVGALQANAFGLYDMHGNVWEWVEDCYHNSYQNAPTDGSAWLSSCRQDGARVQRGGSWYFNTHYARSAFRNFNAADSRSYDVGFRVARTLP